MGQSPEHYSPPAYLLVCISTKWEPVIIPRDAVIAESKLTDYLLDPRLYDDKSKYLLQGGFTKENPERLNAAIRDKVVETEAIFDGTNEHGICYRVEGDLTGVNGRILPVATIWLQWHKDSNCDINAVEG